MKQPRLPFSWTKSCRNTAKSRFGDAPYHPFSDGGLSLTDKYYAQSCQALEACLWVGRAIEELISR